MLDGSHDTDYEQGFKMLLKLIDSALDEFKVELQQLVFPYFTILYLTMIRRGFDAKASEFMDSFKHLIFNPDLPMLKSIKTNHDLVSSLNADKYLLNKFQVKFSEQSKELILQFFKFENLVLLMQIANSSLDFKICRERNIVDLKTTLN